LKEIKNKNIYIKRQKEKPFSLPLRRWAGDRSEDGRGIAGIAETVRVRAASEIERSLIGAKRRRIGPEASGAPNHRFQSSPHRLRQRIHHPCTSLSLSQFSLSIFLFPKKMIELRIEGENNLFLCFTCVCVCVYIYIYIHILL
jgi:hypothetical protein